MGVLESVGNDSGCSRVESFPINLKYPHQDQFWINTTIFNSSLFVWWCIYSILILFFNVIHKHYIYTMFLLIPSPSLPSPQPKFMVFSLVIISICIYILTYAQCRQPTESTLLLIYTCSRLIIWNWTFYARVHSGRKLIRLLSVAWLPVPLCLDVGPSVISTVHIGMSTVIMLVLFRQQHYIIFCLFKYNHPNLLFFILDN